MDIGDLALLRSTSLLPVVRPTHSDSSHAPLPQNRSVSINFLLIRLFDRLCATHMRDLPPIKESYPR